MNSLRHKIVAAAAVAVLVATSVATPALARGDRAWHGGGFHGGGIHHGPRFAGGGFHHGWGHGGFRHHHRIYGVGPNWRYAGPGYYHGPGYYYGGYGYDGLGLGLGFTAGLIGGALAASDAPYYESNRTVAYCEARFKSYNRATGTYLGYDGLRHRCP